MFFTVNEIHYAVNQSVQENFTSCQSKRSILCSENTVYVNLQNHLQKTHSMLLTQLYVTYRISQVFKSDNAPLCQLVIIHLNSTFSRIQTLKQQFFVEVLQIATLLCTTAQLQGSGNAVQKGSRSPGIEEWERPKAAIGWGMSKYRIYMQIATRKHLQLPVHDVIASQTSIKRCYQQCLDYSNQSQMNISHNTLCW